MSYIIGEDRNQVQFVSVSLDDLIDQNNSVRVIDAYVDSLDLVELGFNGLKYCKYKCTVCEQCPKKNFCTTSTSGRTIQRWEYEAVLEKVFAETASNDHIYKQRRCIVEHPFGTIKRQFGYSFFLRRGIENVDAECASMFIAYNLKRLFGMLSVTELKKKFETCRA